MFQMRNEKREMENIRKVNGTRFVKKKKGEWKKCGRRKEEGEIK